MTLALSQENGIDAPTGDWQAQPGLSSGAGSPLQQPITLHPSSRQSLSLAAALHILVAPEDTGASSPTHAHSWSWQHSGHGDAHVSRYRQGGRHLKPNTPGNSGEATASASQLPAGSAALGLRFKHRALRSLPGPASQPSIPAQQRWLLPAGKASGFGAGFTSQPLNVGRQGCGQGGWGS